MLFYTNIKIKYIAGILAELKFTFYGEGLRWKLRIY
jgi:hypothetical protein